MIGNMVSDGTWTYTWEHGRQLAGMSDGDTNWNYTYDADGLRTKRTDGDTTYEYVYYDGLLQCMFVNGTPLYFTYTPDGAPMGVVYQKAVYFYVTNLQGDVVALVRPSGEEVVRYTYDAWGNVLSVTGNRANAIGAINPIRYRGYVYDQETGLYYVSSRYYNPENGRFINADAFVSTGQSILGYNMFAYCGNNPSNRVDYLGYCYGYADNPNLDSPFSGVRYGYNCGSYGRHVRNPQRPAKAQYPTASGKSVVIYDAEITPSNEVLNNPNNVVAYDKRYGTNNPNIQVLNSWLIEDPTIQRQILDVLYKYDQSYPSQVMWDRTVNSMLIEWAAHNFFAPFDQSAKDTDFDKFEERKNFVYFFGKAADRAFKKYILPHLPLFI